MKYRVPDISEFVQDFEYEVYVENTVGWILIDFKAGTKEISPMTTTGYWLECKVWWDRPPKMQTTKWSNGVTVHWMEYPAWDLRPPHNIQDKLDKGHIRVIV